MKVTTEGCLFGAVIGCENAEQILDIGAGTGLLTLMMAQRTYGQIKAVEIDESSAGECCDNFQASPWKERLHIVHSSIQEFAIHSNERFDLIVSNPPFYDGHQKTENGSRSRAMHSDHLNSFALISAVSVLLNNNGKFWVLYPEFQADQFIEKASRNGLYLANRFDIYNRPEETIFRSVLEFQRSKSTAIITHRLNIRNDDNEYSEEFSRLLAPYYLYLQASG